MADKAITLLAEYTSGREILSLNDALELHNALAFEEHDILPSFLGHHERATLEQAARELRKRVSSFFLSIDASNLDFHLDEFEYEYGKDLILLLVRYDVAKKCGSQTLFDALVNAQVPLTDMLSNHKFVKKYNHILREALLADSQNGEFLVRTRMTKDSDFSYFLPESFGSNESRRLLSAYIDSPSPHPNYIQAIAEAKDNEGAGITTKIRLQAKKRLETLTKELFTNDKNVLTTYRYGIRIDPEQREPVLDCLDRDENCLTHVRSFGEQYLLSSMEPQRVLRNFAFLVGYLDGHGLLRMPSFKAQLGLFQNFFISGKETYLKGSTFNLIDSLTLQGTLFYSEFLRQHGVEIEAVVAWFFREHLIGKFGAANFYYAPSSSSSSFLERLPNSASGYFCSCKKVLLFCLDGTGGHRALIF